ncbi:hypothetical protein EDC01DRAFT_629939 [Geopyxis carbonaria]|nr:hypothetical protein EDC01DRAFT_629939 [Geopyxis carbonaria]
MNSEHIRLLQAAVGISEDSNSIPQNLHDGDIGSVNNSIDDIEFGDLQADEIEKLLVQLSSSEQATVPPQPDQAASNRNFEYGSGELESTVFDALKHVLHTNEIANGIDYQNNVKDEDGELCDEARIATEIENSIEEMSRSVTRANSPPSRLQPQPSSQPSPTPRNQIYGHSVQSTDFEALTALLNNENHYQISGAQSVEVSYDPIDNSQDHSGNEQPVEDELDPVKAAERERVREENRERKKRWREINQDRNKDNDLRCRVTKRATKLFGPEQSAERNHWIQEEFSRRRTKREQKEKARNEVPGYNGTSGVFYQPRPEHDFQSHTASPNDPQQKIISASDIIHILGTKCSRDGPVSPTMQQLTNYLVANPKTLEQVIHVAITVYGNKDIYHILNLAGSTQPTEFRDESPQEEMPVPTSLSYDNIPDLPEGFDAIIADIQKSIAAPTIEENPVSSEPIEEPTDILSKIQTAEEVDELLAALQAADEAEQIRQAEEIAGIEEIERYEEIVASPTPILIENGTSSIEDDIFASVAGLEGMDEFTDEMTEELLGQLITQRGFDPDTVDIDELLDSLNAQNDNDENIDGVTTNIEGTAVLGESNNIDNDDSINNEANIDNSTLLENDFKMDIDNAGDLEGMDMDQIDALLIELQSEHGESSHHTLGVESPGMTFLPAPYARSRSSSPVYDHFSAQYSPDIVAAVLRSLLENLPQQPSPPPPPPPPTPSYRGTKRPSTSSLVAPATKRVRRPSPNTSTPIAVHQLPGFLESSMDVRPNSATQVTSAYAASFGNSDAMNKRLIALKPPPYRPVPSTKNSTTPTNINIAPPKKKEDEKKIKAMGFPPLMAGIKRN